ncbi:MAG: TIM barrel protein, partial [Clostridia bacterium]
AVGVLGDTFHMAAAQEPLCTLTEIGARLYHVHIAEVTRRVCPSPGDGGDYAAIFDALQAGGYAGRVSIEGRMGDLITEGAVAVRLLHACME